MKYIPLFILIQLVSLVLTLVGIPICAALAYGNFSKPGRRGLWHWPKLFWLWDNEEDGVWCRWYRAAHPSWSVARQEFYWTAFRNPCNNLRFVWGVSANGRPLWRRTWLIRGTWYYAQAGWNGSGYPVFSAGSV
ncbi:MAG: hypothetical protein ACHQ9S_18935 [Candidatus Binatia bacterium]